MKISIYCFEIMVILLVGCRSNTNKSRLITKNDSGYKISSYIGHFLLSDSIFNKANKLKEIDEYFPGSIEEKQKVRIFGEQIGDSSITELYSNGRIKKSIKSFGTNEIIETKSFSNNGALRQYEFYDPIYNKYYRRNYENDKILDEVGEPFFSAYLNLKDDFFSEKDSIKAFFIAPTPPDCKTVLYTFQDNQARSNISQIDSSSFFKVEIYPLKKGSYEWTVYLELKNIYTDQISKSAFKKIRFTVK